MCNSWIGTPNNPESGLWDLPIGYCGNVLPVTCVFYLIKDLYK